MRGGNQMVEEEDMDELEDEDELEGEDGEGIDDFDNMVLPADLIAAAQEMDMKLDPAQIKQLQEYLAQQQENPEQEEEEEEDDSNL